MRADQLSRRVDRVVKRELTKCERRAASEAVRAYTADPTLSEEARVEIFAAAWREELAALRQQIAEMRAERAA